MASTEWSKQHLRVIPHRAAAKQICDVVRAGRWRAHRREKRNGIVQKRRGGDCGGDLLERRGAINFGEVASRDAATGIE